MKDNNTLISGTEDDFDEIIKISSKLKVPSSTKGKEAVWEKLLQSIEEDHIEETKFVPLVVATKFWFSIAATILGLIAVGSLTYRYTMVEVQLAKGQVLCAFLPDSSEVKLNSESEIVYRKYGWLKNREVALKGEAFFSVKHGSQFIITTEFDRKVIVTGTKFNVLARGDFFEVKCFDGSVRVQTPLTKPILLTKGKGISFNRDGDSPIQIIADSISEPTWIKGEFYFNNIPLNLVLDEFSRQFNVIFKIDGIDASTRSYTGYFNRHQMIQALDFICIPMELAYQFSSDSTTVFINK